MADLGRAALVTSFLLLVYASVMGAFAAWHRRRRLAESAQNALLGAFAATAVAAAVLLVALARHDFSFQYVAQHTSRELPLGYTLTAFWGGQEGSLLLWLLVLCGYSVAAVLTARRAGREVLAWVVPTLGFVGSLALVFLRLPLLRAKTRLESLVSREATFLYNNLLLVALALTILWGVVYPLLSEAVTGEASTVSKPYYNFFLHTFGLPLLLLMGIGPLVAWRRASLRALGRTFLWPIAAALAAGAVLLGLGAGSSRIGVIAYTFSVFVLASIVLEFARGTRARKALGTGGWLDAFASLVARNRRRYGGEVGHAPPGLLAIGVAGSSAYQTVREQRLSPGESMRVAGYTMTFEGVTQGRS